MRILSVVHDFLPKHLGGAELYTYYLSKALANKGHEVRIYTQECGNYDRQLSEDDTEYNGLKIKTVYFNDHQGTGAKFLNKVQFKFYLPFLDEHFSQSPNKLLRQFYHDFFNPVLEKHFKDYLDETRPDIIHFQHLKGLSASFISVASKKKIPVVLTLHDYWFMCSTIQLLNRSTQRCTGPLYGTKCPKCVIPPAKNSPIVWGLYPFLAILFFLRTIYLKRLLNKVDLIISPSNFLRKKFIEHGVSEEKIIFSDNGITPSMLRTSKKPNSKLTFAFIGSVMPHKGVHLLIKAFNKISNGNARLRVYGDPGYAPQYYEKLSKMAINPNIKFMGHFDNKRVYKILREIDVLVVPSIWYENSPLTIHEAALAGVPVITSNIGGMAELVERMHNGLLFKVEDTEDLYQKIDSIIKSPKLLRRFKGSAPAVKTLNENVSELEKIYEKLIQNRTNGRL